jgi:electron transfer flavoprotein beta subunit
MNIVVLAKLVPDLVEELVIDAQGSALDSTWLRYKLNEQDDHAIEQAILLKERHGAHVTVIVPGLDGADDALFAAAAKGADRLVKLSAELEQNPSNHSLAQTVASLLRDTPPELILTGVQAHNDLDGAVGALLAGLLDAPYVGYVAGVRLNGGNAVVRKEYPGGLIAELEVTLPAVLGIQAAERPPSYIAFSKIRQAMKTATIEELPASALAPLSVEGLKMFKPETGARATLLEGSPEQVAEQLVEIFHRAGVL